MNNMKLSKTVEHCNCLLFGNTKANYLKDCLTNFFTLEILDEKNQ